MQVYYNAIKTKKERKEEKNYSVNNNIDMVLRCYEWN